MGFLDQKETQQRRALVITAGAIVLFLIVLVVAVVLSVTQRNQAQPTVGEVTTEETAEVSDVTNNTTQTNNSQTTNDATSEPAEAAEDATGEDLTANDTGNAGVTEAPTPTAVSDVPDTGPESLALVAGLIGVATTLFLVNRQLRRELAVRGE